MRFIWSILLLVSCTVQAADISDPTKFMFVGDRTQNIIDVLSVKDAEVVHRIETSIHPDHIVATPFAPILMYADVKLQQAVFYDLDKQVEISKLDLPMTPRHVVLDTTGSKIGISDNVEGGFVLIHAYKKTIEFALEDFPATAEVLFDPNDVDIYFSDVAKGSLGLLDINTQRIYEMTLVDEAGAKLSSPSRSLDARYLYVANITTGEVYSLNAYSNVIFKTFDFGGVPARPYTTPQGAFMYMLDEENGRLVSVEQNGFTEFATAAFDHGVDLVTVGRFDRMNLFLSSSNRHWSIFDNVTQAVVASGTFKGTPIGALGAADGKLAFIAFADIAEVALVDLEDHTVKFVPATQNGSGAFTVGLSNNVCH